MPNPKSTKTTVTTQTIENYEISNEDWAAIEAYLNMNNADKASVRSFIADVEANNVSGDNVSGDNISGDNVSDDS